MRRFDIIETIGRPYLKENSEEGEFNYEKAANKAGLVFKGIQNSRKNRTYKRIDLRFVKNDLSILIETKTDFLQDKESESQLSAYVQYEKDLTGNKVIAILANTNDDRIRVWKEYVEDSCLLSKEIILRSLEEYSEIFDSKINDKRMVMQNTYKLNGILHNYGISEKYRSQFVGTCLLTLKNGLKWKGADLTKKNILTNIKDILENLLEKNLEKATKIVLLNNVLKNQDIKVLELSSLRIILKFIEENIIHYINDKNTSGQDLLNLFFITFNKYVGKADKNQAFTPDHITDFMSKITQVNKNTRVLDPCCGSGSFLVRAMTQAIDDCDTAKEIDIVKKEHIWGIEFSDTAYGLATTNMLIHSDGNSNIYQGNCFKNEDKVLDAMPDVILMNPPYNAQRKHMEETFTETWGPNKKEDPSKGLKFVQWIADLLEKEKPGSKIAVLLPMSCAIGNSKVIKTMKNDILQKHTLDAVFSLPEEVFYPGASVSACCMIFIIGQKHENAADTFFGYFREDGFKKRKNLGRVEQVDKETGLSQWAEIERNWIELYRNRRVVDGLSATHKVTGDDEWLCEAYMNTDYSTLVEADFQETVNNYISFLVKQGNIDE